MEMRKVQTYNTSIGNVVIYKITPSEKDSFVEFYIVFFNDAEYGEEPWGVGLTSKIALERAADEWDVFSNEWDDFSDDIPDVNPFREVLEKYY
jgi:hypothetical protein